MSNVITFRADARTLPQANVSTAELRQCIENGIQRLIDALDEIDSRDMDREDDDPVEHNGDLEPSLGALTTVDQRSAWSCSPAVFDGEASSPEYDFSSDRDAVWIFRGDRFKARDLVTAQLRHNGRLVDLPFQAEIKTFTIGAPVWLCLPRRNEGETAAMVTFSLNSGSELIVQCRDVAWLRHSSAPPSAPPHIASPAGRRLRAPAPLRMS